MDDVKTNHALTIIRKAIPIRNNLTVPEGTLESNNGHYRRTLSAFNDMREITGAALYISLACRPDTMFAAHQLTLIANKPNEDHWKAAVQLLQYLKATSDRKLIYQRNPNYSLDTKADQYQPKITAYCDSDYGTDRATRRSITGYVILLDGNPIHWCSRRQPITAVSSTEAEYIALAECAKEVLWVSHLIQQLTGRALQNTPTIHVDNQAAIHCANNGIHNSHINTLAFVITLSNNAWMIIYLLSLKSTPN